MIARLATFTGIDLDLVDEVQAWNRAEALPRIRALEGYRAGLSILSREERTVRAITIFDTEENLGAAESTFEELPKLMPQQLRQRIEASGRRGPMVEICEVLLSDGVAADAS